MRLAPVHFARRTALRCPAHVCSFSFPVCPVQPLRRFSNTFGASSRCVIQTHAHAHAAIVCHRPHSNQLLMRALLGLILVRACVCVCALQTPEGQSYYFNTQTNATTCQLPADAPGRHSGSHSSRSSMHQNRAVMAWRAARV